jgi:hypothetical protein
MKMVIILLARWLIIKVIQFNTKFGKTDIVIIDINILKNWLFVVVSWYLTHAQVSFWHLWLRSRFKLFIQYLFNEHLTMLTAFITTQLVFIQDFLLIQPSLLCVLTIRIKTLICPNNYHFKIIFLALVGVILSLYTNHIQLIHLHYKLSVHVFDRWWCNR